MRKGFTLIEMMIVVAIIAIIAAIAIPSLLAARRSSLETNAVGSCRAYCEAQTMYHRNDFTAFNAGHGVLGVLEYAIDPGASNQGFTWLNTDLDGGGNAIQLIDGAFSAAIVATAPKHGYWFQDIQTIGGTAVNPATDLGLSALPATYGRTGYRTFIVMTNGTTFGQDQGPAGVQIIDYPADPILAGWIIAE
jgi:prepilin-type N-terminal cleavage/methylation domain-containing protein